MRRYLIKKVGLAIFVSIGITILTFLLGVLSPGDPAEIVLSSGGNYTPSEAELEIVREEMGLDDPYYVQYGKWVLGLFRGDLGTSYRTGTPVLQELKNRLLITACIAFFSVLLTSVAGIGFGIMMTLWHNKFAQKFGHIFSMLSISVPSFWFAIILIFVFSEQLKWLPTSGQGTWKNLIMPVVVLSVGTVGMVIRLMHSSLDTQMRRHYALVASSKGMNRSRVVLRHVVVNSLIPVVTMIGNNFGSILGGAAIIESVFAINGLGRYALESITYRDYPALRGYVLLTGLTFVLINLLLDVIYIVLNPKIRLENKISM